MTSAPRYRLLRQNNRTRGGPTVALRRHFNGPRETRAGVEASPQKSKEVEEEEEEDDDDDEERDGLAGKGGGEKGTYVCIYVPTYR